MCHTVYIDTYRGHSGAQRRSQRHTHRQWYRHFCAACHSTVSPHYPPTLGGVFLMRGLPHRVLSWFWHVLLRRLAGASFAALAAAGPSSSPQGPRRRRGSMHNIAHSVTLCAYAVVHSRCRAANRTHAPHTHTSNQPNLQTITLNTHIHCAHRKHIPYVLPNLVHYKHRTLAPYLTGTAGRRVATSPHQSFHEAVRTTSTYLQHPHKLAPTHSPNIPRT